MPRLRRSSTQLVILVIWLVGLVFSGVSVAWIHAYIETEFTTVLTWVVGAFAPTIALMGGVYFARRKEPAPAVEEAPAAAWLAIILSLLYVGAVCSLVFAFVTDRIELAKSFLETGELVRALSVVVTAPIAFYFGKPNPASDAAVGE